MLDPQAIDDAVLDGMNRHKMVGVGVGVVVDEELAFSKGYGLANAVEGHPITPRTVFRIGSVAKTITAIGLMRLWEEGHFQLDDPVNEHLKAFRVAHPDADAPPVTFRHLLTHTSGIGELRKRSDLFRPSMLIGPRVGSRLPSPGELYGPVLRTELPPERKWAYANLGFGTLGQVIQDISGRAFPEYMTANVFEPLGMSHSDYLRTERVGPQLAAGYKVRRGTPRAVTDREIIHLGAGSVYSSVEDMGRYVAALMNGGSNEFGQVLKPETLELMLRPQFSLGGRPIMGLAFNLQDWNGHPIVGHGGNWHGFDSSMLIAPTDKVGVVVFSNTNSFLGQDLIAMKILRDILRVPDPTDLPKSGVPEHPELWGELSGVYRPDPGFLTNFRAWSMLGGEIQISVRDQHLALRGVLGPIRKSNRLYPVDEEDPYSFRMVVRGYPIDVWFYSSRDTGRPAIALGVLNQESFKCTMLKSVRTWTTASGAATGASAATALFRRLRRRHERV